MIKETSRGHSKSLCRDLALVFMYLLSGLIIVSVSQSAALRGKVTSVQGNAIELDAGAEKGIRLGDPGRVYYVVRIEGKEKPIYVAKFKITRLSERSSVGQVEEKTVDVRPGYFVEISSIREGELDIKSEPSGAKVYLDGNPVGVSPYEAKDLSPGTRKVKVVKEGYEPWEKEVAVEAGKKVRVLAKMKEKTEVSVSPPPLPSPSPAVKPERPKEKEAKAVDFPKTTKEADLTNKSVDAPVWKAGNKWRYRNPAGNTWVNEVVEVKNDVYIFKGAGRKNLYAYDKKTMHAVYAIGTDKTVTKITNDNDTFRLFDFPLFVGKKWVVSTKEGSSTLSGEFEVEGVEDLQTPAGRFMTFRIHLKQTNLSSKNTGWIRYWYAPEVGQRVKQEVEKSRYWAKITWLVDYEMIAYELK